MLKSKINTWSKGTCKVKLFCVSLAHIYFILLFVNFVYMYNYLSNYWDIVMIKKEFLHHSLMKSCCFFMFWNYDLFDCLQAKLSAIVQRFIGNLDVFEHQGGDIWRTINNVCMLFLSYIMSDFWKRPQSPMSQVQRNSVPESGGHRTEHPGHFCFHLSMGNQQQTLVTGPQGPARDIKVEKSSDIAWWLSVKDAASQKSHINTTQKTQ